MTLIERPICSGCKHFDREADVLRCDAFDRIPDTIIKNEADHRNPVDGDNGIRFDPLTKADAAYAARVLEGVK